MSGKQSSDPVLELVDVSLHYASGPPWSQAKTPAVRAVSLRVEKGETLGLVGESGSGKTSVGRLSLGMVRPTSGQVFLNGLQLRHKDPRARGKLQVVLQHPEWSLNPRLRCGTSVAEPLVVSKRARGSVRRRMVEETLELVGLERAIADRYPHELSGGQRQRVAIARALITSPDLVVFDEVVSSLDVSVQAQILNLIKRLQAERGFAALFISHDLGVVRYVSHRVAVMYAGEIVELLPAGFLYSGRSGHPYSRALMEASEGNPSQYQLRESFELAASGCALAPRCPLAVAACRVVHPPLRELDGLLVACHRAEEVVMNSPSLSGSEALADG